MDSFRVEYLITVDQKEMFCGSITAFNHLLKTIDLFAVRAQHIVYKELQIAYEVQTGEIASDKQRYFHVRFVSNDTERIDLFEEFLKIARGVFYKANGERPPQVLWDDTSLYYAQTAYPLINEIENTLRKLITKFMQITVGLAWTSNSVPKEVADSIRTRKGDSSYLYDTDFIQLSNYLFKDYVQPNSRAVTDKIRQAKSLDELTLDELKTTLPKSNWERYFSNLVNCESDYLRIRWEKLYEIRNLVAHNKPMGKVNLADLEKLINEIKPKLQEAIDKLDQVTISEEDKEAVAENAAENTNALYGEFLMQWKALNIELYEIALKQNSDKDEARRVDRARYSPRMLLQQLALSQSVNPQLRRSIIKLNGVRNNIVHEAKIEYSEEVMEAFIAEIQSVRRDLSGLSELINNAIDVQKDGQEDGQEDGQDME